MATRLRNRFGSGEAGLTMIEVMIATVILVLGAMATFGLLSTATKNAQRAKANQVVLDLAQEEMERMRSQPYPTLAVSRFPTADSNPLNPNSRIQGTTFALKRSPVGERLPLVYSEEGISPESPFSVGDPEHGAIRGTVYRYVVWRQDAGCPGAYGCSPDGHDYKQLVIAVKPEKTGNLAGERGYVEVQSEFIDPEGLPEPPPPDSGGDPDPEGDPGGPPGGPSGSPAQQFFLSDTSCVKTGKTTRIDIAGDHLLHNTLGSCADGLKTGSTPGAPDTLLLSQPPDPEPLDETKPYLYDYSDDFYLEPTPDTDKGLQIRREDTVGCHFTPTGAANPESQVHRWVTDTMASTFVMTDKVTLEISTRTLNDALHTGTLCVFLFKRSESGGSVSDTMLSNADNGKDHWTYTPEGNGFWPRFSWAKIRLTMAFESAPYTIPTGDRLGIAIGVERANTPADAIPIMYDHPNHPTRIEVATQTPIEGG